MSASAVQKAFHLNPSYRAGRGDANAMRLLSIANVLGCEALATRQRLEFAPQGLTVLDGDSGSGKSGYVRILKHVDLRHLVPNSRRAAQG
jgi:hypothetical protein